MIVQNNPSPWVFLALIGLAGSIVLGILLSGTELFNPTREKQEAYAAGTLAAMGAKTTHAILAATQTPQAAFAQAVQTQAALPAQATQTSQAMIARATEIVGQQTATSIAAQSLLAAQGINATQTAIVVEAQNRIIESRATQTAIAQAVIVSQQQASTEEIMMTLDLIGQSLLLVLPAILITSAFVLILVNARAKEKAAAAKMYAEMRRTLEVQAAVGAKNHIPTQSRNIQTPFTSLSATLRKNGDNDLPTAA